MELGFEMDDGATDQSGPGLCDVYTVASDAETLNGVTGFHKQL